MLLWLLHGGDEESIWMSTMYWGKSVDDLQRIDRLSDLEDLSWNKECVDEPV